MDNDYGNIRLEAIYKLLMELVKGNLSYQVERTGFKDDLEAIALLLKMVMEEVKESFIYQGYVNSEFNYGHLATSVFLLDPDFRVHAINPLASKLLYVDANKIVGDSLEGILLPKSLEEWKKATRKIKDNPDLQIEVNLLFKANNGLSLNSKYILSNLSHNKNDYYILASVEVVLKKITDFKRLLGKQGKTKSSLTSNQRLNKVLKANDLLKVRQAHDHILRNLEHPIGSLRELALNYGTNEFKLKTGFRQLYHTSVFKFQKVERLRKSLVLLENTAMSIKSIASKVGFKSPAHFSRAFKEQYGFTPQSVRQKKNG